MPRANRHFLPGYLWHITHQRCSQFQSFQSFNRCAPFKTFIAGTSVKNPRPTITEVCAGPAPLSALALRSKEAVRSLGTGLHGDIQPRSPDVGPVSIVPIVQSLALRSSRYPDNRGSKWYQHSKRAKRCETIVGPSRSPSGVWHSSRPSKARQQGAASQPARGLARSGVR